MAHGAVVRIKLWRRDQGHWPERLGERAGLKFNIITRHHFPNSDRAVERGNEGGILGASVPLEEGWGLESCAIPFHLMLGMTLGTQGIFAWWLSVQTYITR